MSEDPDEDLINQIYTNRLTLIAAFGVFLEQSEEFRERLLTAVKGVTEDQIDHDLKVLLQWAGVVVSFDTDPEMLTQHERNEAQHEADKQELWGMYL